MVKIIFFLVCKLTFIFLITIAPLLLAVAFLTLLERKAMASFQSRRGPNIVGFFGLLQPIADGLKLLFKETVIPYKSSMVLYIFAPLLSFGVSLILWFIIPNCLTISLVHSNVNLLLLLGFSGLNVYGIIISGWSSNSNYALLGALRSASQMISYEISLSLVLLPLVAFCKSLNIIDIINAQEFIWFGIIFFPNAILFFISMLAETNRVPFDLPEAEAELVSGYNVEYSSLYFALFFLSEYANILLLSFLFTCCFLGGPFVFGMKNVVFFMIKYLAVIFVFIWVRSTYPRYRFDQLMAVGWKNILPLSLIYLFFLCLILL